MTTTTLKLKGKKLYRGEEGTPVTAITRLSWTRDHKSKDGRFWCYKPPRSDEWQLWDSRDRDSSGSARRYRFRKLSDCKEMADLIVERSNAR